MLGSPSAHDVDFDVIVVGAGPAGLSVASKLADRHRVLVLDAKPEQPRGRARLTETPGPRGDGFSDGKGVHKSWFCPHDCLYDNPELLDSRKPGGVTRFLARTYSGPAKDSPELFDLAWNARQFPDTAPADQYPYLDEYKLVAHFEQRILDSPHRSAVRSGHRYQDHTARPDRVDVRFLVQDSPLRTRSVAYTCRLLLDASGSDSDVRKRYPDEQKDTYWWTVAGALCTHPEGQIVTAPTPGHPLVVGDYMLWQTFAASTADPSTPVRDGRPVFEYEILDTRHSFPLVLYLRPHRISLDRARAEFLHVVRNEPATAPFHRAEITELKYGHYPSGRGFRSYAHDRVDFIGDAGLWTTPCGWGASFILKNYAPYAERLSRLLTDDRLDKRALRALPRAHAKEAEFFMNSVITRFLAFGTVAQLDAFIGLFREIDPVICERIFTLRVTPQDLLTFGRAAARRIGVRSLLRSLPPGERLRLLRDLARAAAQFGQEEVVRRATGRSPERGFGVYGPDRRPTSYTTPRPPEPSTGSVAAGPRVGRTTPIGRTKALRTVTDESDDRGQNHTTIGAQQ